MGNSLKAEDIERGLRGAEEELRLTEREPHGKGGGKKGRPVFWMEQGGEWALLNAMEEDMEDWLQCTLEHWVGSTSDLASNYGVLGIYIDLKLCRVPLVVAMEMALGSKIWMAATLGGTWMLSLVNITHQDAAGAFWAWMRLGDDAVPVLLF